MCTVISSGNLLNLCLYPCLLQQLVLTCVVLVPPCPFPPFVRFNEGELRVRMTPAVTRHGNSLVHLTHTQQRLLPELSPPFNGVPQLALGPVGRKGGHLLGGAATAVVPLHKDPLQRRPSFHRDKKEANSQPFRLSSLCQCQGQSKTATTEAVELLVCS